MRKVTRFMHHHDNLPVQGRKLSRTHDSYFVSCCFLSAGSAPIPSQSLPHTGATCLNAKSRHCRSGYLCARTRARKTFLVFGRRDSRMISPTRSPRRVSPTHAPRKIIRRWENALNDSRESREYTGKRY